MPWHRISERTTDENEYLEQTRPPLIILGIPDRQSDYTLPRSQVPILTLPAHARNPRSF